jgi:hypothetical protein
MTKEKTELHTRDNFLTHTHTLRFTAVHAYLTTDAQHPSISKHDINLMVEATPSYYYCWSCTNHGIAGAPVMPTPAAAQ